MPLHQRLLERGKEAFGRGNYAEALGSLSRVAEERPDYADVRNWLGPALHFSGRPLEALEQFHRALAINPRYIEVHVNLALVLNDLGRHEARAEFDDVRLERARGYLQQGRLTLAASEFGKLLARRPDHLQARLGLGLVHFRPGERERAREAWKACRRAAPGDGTAEVYLAML